MTNSSCEHSVCSDCFRRLPFDFNTRLRRCPLDRKLFTDIRYSTINVCVIPRPSPEELQTTHDPVLDDDEAEYERQRAEEERLNREAAQLLQDQMNNTGSNEPGKENDVPNLLYVKCVSTVSIQRFINFFYFAQLRVRCCNRQYLIVDSTCTVVLFSFSSPR